MNAKDKLKGIYAITPPKFDETKLLNDINICLSCGVKIFQIRYKEEITIELKDFFSVLVMRIKEKEGISIINDFPQLAHDIGADGVHLGKADLSVDAVKNKYKNLIIGKTCKSSIEEAKKAIDDGANYVSFGAFSNSSTKKEAIPIEKSDLDLINKFNVPNKAIIGGISKENFHKVAELNFDMIALSNAIFNSQDTAKSASFFVNNFNFE
jgi:thiamine-phosphate pyrophosphorylase